MKRNYFISVAMATYNGEKYIEEQLNSILKCLQDDDEIVISDDGSTDSTIKIIKKYQKDDKRIKLTEGPKNGVKQNFANAIKACNGRYIFLSDQDDIWSKDKVDTVLKAFATSECSCVVHDCEVFDSDNNKILYKSFYKYCNSGSGIIKNIVKNTYIGCCMAFKKDIVKYILPIPNDIAMHDQWIGILSEKHGGSIFIKDKLIRYRRHSNNVSSMKHQPIIKMVKNRITFIKQIIKRR